jgi:magnesium transporter
MINAFELKNGRLQQRPIHQLEDLTGFMPVWVDLESPTLQERLWIKETFDLILPDEDDIANIEASARYYEAEDASLHIRTDFWRRMTSRQGR